MPRGGTYIQIRTNAKIVRMGLERLRKRLPDIGRMRLYKAALEIQRRMKEEGKPIKYPVRWDSKKQRRAFFATDGFGGGIPSHRTGKYIRGWKVVKVEKGYRIENQAKGRNGQPYSRYLAGGPRGGRQSRIHQGRWNKLTEVTRIVIRKLPKLVIKDLFKEIRNLLKPTGGAA